MLYFGEYLEARTYAPEYDTMTNATNMTEKTDRANRPNMTNTTNTTDRTKYDQFELKQPDFELKQILT